MRGIYRRISFVNSGFLGWLFFGLIPIMAWEIETTDEYDAWFLEQAENEQEAVRMKVELLTEYGPQLPRPHADTLKGKMAETKVLKKTHPISELDAKMNPAVLAKAKKMAEQESLNIRLGMLREKYGVKQSEIMNFTQTAVSKLENRKDIRISTLIDYLDSLGMGLEITAYPRNSADKELLLRV